MISPTRPAHKEETGSNPWNPVSKLLSGVASAATSFFDQVIEEPNREVNVNLLKITPHLLATFSNELRMIHLAKKQVQLHGSENIFGFCHLLIEQSRMEHERQELRIQRAKLVIGQVIFLMETNFNSLVAIIEAKKDAINEIRKLFESHTNIAKQKLELTEKKNVRVGIQNTPETQIHQLATELARFLVTSTGCINYGLVECLFEKLDIKQMKWKEFLEKIADDKLLNQAFFAIREPLEADSQANDFIRSQIGLNSKAPVVSYHAKQAALAALLTRIPYQNVVDPIPFAVRDLEFFGKVLQGNAFLLKNCGQDPFLSHPLTFSKDGSVNNTNIYLWQIEGLQAAAKQMGIDSINKVWEELKEMLFNGEEKACCTSWQIIHSLAICAGWQRIVFSEENTDLMCQLGVIGFSACGINLLGKMAPKVASNSDDKVNSIVWPYLRTANVLMRSGNPIETVEMVLQDCLGIAYLPADSDFRMRVLQFAYANLVSQEIAYDFQIVMKEMDKQFEKPLSIQDYAIKILGVVNELMGADDRQKTKNHQMLTAHLLNDGLDKSIAMALWARAIPLRVEGLSVNAFEREFFLVFDPVSAMMVRAGCSREKLAVEILDQLQWDRIVAE